MVPGKMRTPSSPAPRRAFWGAAGWVFGGASLDPDALAPVSSVEVPLVPDGTAPVSPVVAGPVVVFGLEPDQEFVSVHPTNPINANPINASIEAPVIIERRIVASFPGCRAGEGLR